MLAIHNPIYGGTSKNTESLASIHTEIRFIEIPETIPAPPPEALAVSPASAFTSYFIDHKTLVKDTIVNQVMAHNPAPIASVVVDMFCTAFIDVAKELGVPSHVFYTSDAAFLATMLYLSDREDKGEPKFRPTDPDYIIPCYSNPVPYRLLPLLHIDVEYEAFANHGREFKDSNEIRFIKIPETIPAPPPEALAVSPASAYTSYINDHKTLVKDTIVNQVMAHNPAPIASVVVDMFCTAFIDVAKELGVPSHVFYTSDAAFLAMTLYLSDRQDKGEPKFSPTDPDYIIPCFSNPVPYRVMSLLHTDVEYETFANHGRKFKDSNATPPSFGRK
ncbi:hypothetical protein D5086_028712 [Populus alba]|uniref:Uncharacterized protein n=1 Tax=Populus alba TaxID=43335 RepID=A0ACC4ASC8_POPAL